MGEWKYEVVLEHKRFFILSSVHCAKKRRKACSVPLKETSWGALITTVKQALPLGAVIKGEMSTGKFL